MAHGRQQYYEECWSYGKWLREKNRERKLYNYTKYNMGWREKYTFQRELNVLNYDKAIMG